MLKRLFLLMIVFLPLMIKAQVEMRDTTMLWQHFDYTLDSYYSINTYSTQNIVPTQFDGVVLENEIVRLCLVPEFGARIISFLYKPTGHEQLYQNEVGVPYQIDSNIFYHDWLMVYGGIFPTFPEPEHGKYWNVPWNMEIIEETSDKITVSMWLTDNLNNPSKPGQYNNGVTGITCYFDVSLEKGKPYFDINVRLENNNQSGPYEYWTCISFTPGSDIGNTFSPLNSEIIVPIDQYQVEWNQGNWMQNADQTVQSNNPYVNEYENLAFLSNWDNMGIAYAYPTFNANHLGVINHEEEEGLFRINHDTSVNPGMKFWTWGGQQGLDANPYDFNENARSMIELWAGVSQEFFEDAYFAANEVVEWKESYLTTVGMPGIDYISEEMAFYQELDVNNQLSVYSFLPVDLGSGNLILNYRIEDPLGNIVWSGWDEVNADLAGSSLYTYDLNQLGLQPGVNTLHTDVTLDGNFIYHSQSESFYIISTSQIDSENSSVEIRHANPSFGSLYIDLIANEFDALQLIDMQGIIVQEDYTSSNHYQFHSLPPGIYTIRVISGGKAFLEKISVR